MSWLHRFSGESTKAFPESESARSVSYYALNRSPVHRLSTRLVDNIVLWFFSGLFSLAVTLLKFRSKPRSRDREVDEQAK
jgi:hypothetical protein